MNSNPTRNVRYMPAFRQWMADGRIVTPAVLAAAKRKDVDTIYAWIKQQRWHEAADAVNMQAIQIMAEAEASREQRLQAAMDAEQDDMIAMLAEQRAILKTQITNLRARQAIGADVDPQEIREATNALLAHRKAAASLGHNWEQVKKVDVTVTETADRDQLLANLGHLLPPELSRDAGAKA